MGHRIARVVLLALCLPVACAGETKEKEPERVRPPAGELEQQVAAIVAKDGALTVTASFVPDDGAGDTSGFADILASVRSDTRALLARMRKAGAAVTEQATPATERATIALVVGERRRDLTMLTDLADVELGPKPVLHRFLGAEVMAWQLRALVAPAKAYWLTGDGKLPGGYSRIVKRLARQGFDSVACGGRPPADCAILIAAQPTWLTVEQLQELHAWIKAGGCMLMTIAHSSELFERSRRFLTDVGIEPGQQQAFNAVKDPMSGDTTFGSQNARIVVLKGFASDNLCTLPFARDSEWLVELVDARAIRTEKGASLLTTEPYAWEGELPRKDGKPDLDKLGKLTVGAFVRVGQGRLGIISGRGFDNGMLNVANANCDLFVRLVDWMAFGLSG